jgi:hypothetical protein
MALRGGRAGLYGTAADAVPLRVGRVIYDTSRQPGFGLILVVLGSVLIFVQACLAVQSILNGLNGLGFFEI